MKPACNFRGSRSIKGMNRQFCLLGVHPESVPKIRSAAVSQRPAAALPNMAMDMDFWRLKLRSAHSSSVAGMQVFALHKAPEDWRSPRRCARFVSRSRSRQRRGLRQPSAAFAGEFKLHFYVHRNCHGLRIIPGEAAAADPAPSAGHSRAPGGAPAEITANEGGGNGLKNSSTADR